jgi:hypothetical protein
VATVAMKPKLILCLALVLSGGLVGCSTPNHSSSLPIRYRNAQYDFTFSLPADWKGCPVLIQQWEAPLYLYATNESSRKIVGMEHGPIIVLRNPLWKTNDLYQDIPIMVFTRKQWDAERQGIFFPYAGGIIYEMWHHRQYVFGNYSRYNAYDEVKGWREADDIIKQNCASNSMSHFLDSE